MCNFSLLIDFEDGEFLKVGTEKELFEGVGSCKVNFLYRICRANLMPAGIFQTAHDGLKWLPYEEAHEEFSYFSQKHALCELNGQLGHGNLIR